MALTNFSRQATNCLSYLMGCMGVWGHRLAAALMLRPSDAPSLLTDHQGPSHEVLPPGLQAAGIQLGGNEARSHAGLRQGAPRR